MEKLENETLEGLRQFIRRRRQTGEDILSALLYGMEDGRHTLLASPNGDPGFASKLSALCYEEYIRTDSGLHRGAAGRGLPVHCGWMRELDRRLAGQRADGKPKRAGTADRRTVPGVFGGIQGDLSGVPRHGNLTAMPTFHRGGAGGEGFRQSKPCRIWQEPPITESEDTVRTP